MNKIKLALFVQARLTSKRFPNKILSKINNKTIIEILLNKLRKVKNINKIVVLIPDTRRNNKLEKIIKKLKFEIFRGNEKNVLDRFYNAANKLSVKNIIRITSDCPLIDTEIINKMVQKYLKGNYDYATNTMPPTFPDGMDVEIFKFKILQEAWQKAKMANQKEHVTPYIRSNKKFKKLNIVNKKDESKIRITLDCEEDLKLIKKIFKYFNPKIDFGLNEIIKLLKKYPKWLKLNEKFNTR